MSAVMKNHRKFNSFHFCKYANVFLVITPIDQSEIYGKRRAPDTGYPRAASRAITASKKFRQTTECPPPAKRPQPSQGWSGALFPKGQWLPTGTGEVSRIERKRDRL